MAAAEIGHGALPSAPPAAASDSDPAPSARLNSLEQALLRAEKKGKPEAVADALYDLGKAAFEAGQQSRGEELMQRCLEAERRLNRPAATMRAAVALATMLVASKRRSEAMALYEEAMGVAEKNGFTEQAASIADSLGATALLEGDLDRAERLLTSALELARQSGNADSQVKALINLSAVSRARGQPDRALLLLKEALPLADSLTDGATGGTLHMELGSTAAGLGRLDEARRSYAEAARWQKEELDGPAEAKALLALGQVCLRQHDAQEALAAFRRASGLSSGENSPTGRDALIGLGASLAETGDFEAAEATHARVLEACRSAGDTARERKALAEQGYSFLLKGSPEKALSRFLQSLRLASEKEPENVQGHAVLLTDIAMCYKALGQVDAAVSYYGRALAAFDKAGDRSGRAMALTGLAVAYLDSGRFKEFDQHFQQASQLMDELKDVHGQAILAYNKGQYQLLQGYYSDAVALYEDALDKMRTVGDTKGEGQVLRGMGLAYLYLGRAGKALECYQQARPLADASGSMEAQWDCALGMGKAYKALNQTDDALTELRKAVDLVEKERSQLSRDTFKTFNMDLRQDCFKELVEVLVSSGRLGDALEVAERGRARAFLDLLEGRRGLTPAADASRRSSAEVDGGTDAPPSAPLRLAAAAEPGTRAVEVVPRPAAIVEASAISPINALPPSLEEIRTLVARSNSTFVEYYVLPHKVLIWVVHPDGKVEMAPPVVISAAELTQKVAAAGKYIVAQPKSPGEIAALDKERESKLRELHELLVEPVLPYLPSGGQPLLTIVPHGAIFSVPFAALMGPDRRYFVEDYTLSYTPAIGVLRATQKIKADVEKERDNLLAFGNPITRAIAFLGALPYSEKEVRHIAELFGPGRSLVEVGQRATKAAFMRLAPHHTDIHLATHGLIDEVRPMNSALVLAPEAGDDGLLTVKDVLQMPALKARLVALSACQTGRGKITGDGVVGLSRAFIIAGTPSILVSQWNVDDIMTEFQMVAFYKSMLAGTGKAKSLREAQLKTIAFMEQALSVPGQIAGTRKARANPRYWAAFQIIGEPE